MHICFLVNNLFSFVSCSAAKKKNLNRDSIIFQNSLHIRDHANIDISAQSAQPHYCTTSTKTISCTSMHQHLSCGSSIALSFKAGVASKQHPALTQARCRRQKKNRQQHPHLLLKFRQVLFPKMRWRKPSLD